MSKNDNQLPDKKVNNNLPSECMEALASTSLSSQESKILWAIIRKTYGWHKKEDFISLSQFSAITGLANSHVVHTIKRLHERNIIVKIPMGNSKKCIYSLQEDFSIWIDKVLPKQALPKQALPKQDAGTAYPGNQGLPKQADTNVTSTNVTSTNIKYIYMDSIKKILNNDDPDLIKTFHDYVDMRNSSSRHLKTKPAIEAQLKKLKKVSKGEHEYIEIIDYALRRGDADFYALKEVNTSSGEDFKGKGAPRGQKIKRSHENWEYGPDSWTTMEWRELIKFTPGEWNDADRCFAENYIFQYHRGDLPTDRIERDKLRKQYELTPERKGDLILWRENFGTGNKPWHIVDKERAKLPSVLDEYRWDNTPPDEKSKQLEAQEPDLFKRGQLKVKNGLTGYLSPEETAALGEYSSQIDKEEPNLTKRTQRKWDNHIPLNNEEFKEYRRIARSKWGKAKQETL
jgi:phage replication O-like protein O